MQCAYEAKPPATTTTQYISHLCCLEQNSPYPEIPACLSGIATCNLIHSFHQAGSATNAAAKGCWIVKASAGNFNDAVLPSVFLKCLRQPLRKSLNPVEAKGAEEGLLLIYPNEFHRKAGENCPPIQLTALDELTSFEGTLGDVDSQRALPFLSAMPLLSPAAV